MTRPLRRLLPLLLLAACAAAGQTADAWRAVAPAGEKFQVLMPAPEHQVLRELIFEAHLKLVLTSFETYAHGTHLMLMSAGRADRTGEPEVLKTFERFVEGFKYAVAHGGQGAGNEIVAERAFMFEGHPARELKLRLGSQTGAARLYETDKAFYVALALADNPDQAIFDRFLDSLTFKVSGPKPKREQAERSGVTIIVTPKPAERAGVVPAGPWPVHQPRQPIKLGVLNGKALRLPQPLYPASAKAARASGTVVVQILVDEQGKVVAAEAVSGHQLLRPVAVQAAYLARFSPVVLEGQPVKVSGIITYNFFLN